MVPWGAHIVLNPPFPAWQLKNGADMVIWNEEALRLGTIVSCSFGV